MQELAPPEQVFTDPQAVELVRAWLSRDQLLVALQPIDFHDGATEVAPIFG